jgi:serine/threonine protein kinase
MIYSTSQFVDAVVRHSDCALSQPIFSSRHEPCAVNVGHSHVPDGYLDVTFYPDIAQYDELLHNMTTVPASERRRNLDQIHISVPAPASEPFAGIPIVSPAQVVPSGCNTPGKVQKGGEFYFKKLLDPFVKPCHRFIGMNCSKICCQDGCMRVHAVCSDPQNMFMLQPWMERTNRLDKVMSRQPPLPLPERIRIMRRIATAVCAYHDNGLTHCHVCPSKIFLDSQNAPHLMFPGSALLAAKLHYSSPDCVWGSVVSESSDVWSVGVIMYELLFNKPPFDSMSEGDIRDALAPAAPSWPPFDIVAPIPPGLPDDLPALLHRCWHRDASLRISITELARELAEMDPTPKLMQPLPLPLPSPGWQSQDMFDILRAAMPALSDADISAEVALATHKCRSHDARLIMLQRSLTLLEGQSIYIFTTSLIYREFTEAYRSLQNARIQLWNNYASALQSALNKLEPPQLTFPCPPGVPMFLVV